MSSISPPPSDHAALEEVAPISHDALERILEPRVRSNAKNQTKVAKTSGAKTPVAPKTAAPDEITLPVPLEIAREAAQAINNASKAKNPPPAAPAPLADNSEVVQSLGEMRDLIVALQENQLSRDRAFDLLYEELGGYKNDFYLERLKPTLRSLLFLLDSIEGFDREIDSYQTGGVALTPDLVKANLLHFRDQLTDILTLSEMTPVEPQGDKFDPKTQRAIEVVPVEPEQNNTVQRQIRGGWRLSGKMLRPADVVVGRTSNE